jgi:sec-independent protein translocase protein TatA
MEAGMPFNLGPMEMVFVMVVLLMLFGAKRLPELGSGLGKGIREFKRTMREVNGELTAPEPLQQFPPQTPWAQTGAPAVPAQQPLPVQQTVPVQPFVAPPAPAVEPGSTDS